MLEMLHYILMFIITMKHVIYGAILSTARGRGGALQAPPAEWGGALAEIKFDAFEPENPVAPIFHFP